MRKAVFTHGQKALHSLRGGVFVCLAAFVVSACGGAPESDTARPKAARAPQIISKAPVRIMPIDLSAFAKNPPRRADAVVVALLLPMSDARDPIKALAGDLYNGAQLALFDGGITNIILKLHDTKGTPAGAQEAAMAAVAGGADMVVGPLFSSSVKAVAPVLAGRNIPALALSNDSSAAHDHVWLLGFLPEQNITQIVAEAISQGLTRFGALLPEGPFGERIGTSFVNEVTRFGGTIVQIEAYPPDAKQMFEPVKRLAQYDRRKAAYDVEMARLSQEARRLAPDDLADDVEADILFRAIAARAPELVSAYEALKLTETLGDIPYDAVFLPEGGLALRNLAPLLPYYDIDPRRVKFIGTGLWDDATLAQEPPLHGGWYAAPTRDGWVNFAARYERVYRRPPPRLAAMSYDAVSLAVTLAAMNKNAPFAVTQLTDANGFAGIDGIVRLKQGGLNERGLAVQEMTAREPRPVRQAPTSFVAYDRHMRAALALAERLKEENPDRQLSPYEGLAAAFAAPIEEGEGAEEAAESNSQPVLEPAPQPTAPALTPTLTPPSPLGGGTQSGDARGTSDSGNRVRAADLLQAITPQAASAAQPSAGLGALQPTAQPTP